MSESLTEGEAVGGLEDLAVVADCDFHITERQEDFLSYLPEPFNELLVRSDVSDNMGYLKSFYPSSGLLTPVSTGKVQNDPVRSRDAIREGMELLGVTRPVVTPTLNLYLGCVHHDDLAVGLAHAYNEWALESLYSTDDEIFGPVVVAPQKPSEAAEEIDDRAAESSVVAVFVPSGGIHPQLGHEWYYPIYEAAQDHGLPLLFHNASGTQMLSFPQQFQGSNRYLSNHAPTHAMLHMTHLTDMITRGVPVRFPDLEFVFQEAGIGWVPYMKKRLDNEYAEKRDDAAILEQLPSEYIDEQFYFTSHPVEGAKDPEYVTNMIRMLGPDNLLFSSDYPHLDFDHSNALFRAVRGAFSDEQVRRIYGETAVEVFPFPN